MTTQGLLSGKTVWIVFAAYFLFLIAIARCTTWKEKRDAGKVDLQGGRFKWPVMVIGIVLAMLLYRKPKAHSTSEYWEI